MKDCTKQDFKNWLNQHKETYFIEQLGIEHILACVDDEISICYAKSENEFELLNDIREMFYFAYYENFKPVLSGKFI